MKNKSKYIFEIIMLFLSIFMLFPFTFAILNSFKTTAEASKLNFDIPSVWNFSNYVEVFKEGRLLNGYSNSALVSISTVILVVIFGAMAAFVISRRVNKLTKVMFIIFVCGLIPPAFPITTIKLISAIGLKGTFLGLILFYTASYMPFTIFLMTGFFKSIPRELDEAAAIDGCGPLTTFWRIIVPVAKPVIATDVIFVFMWVWNDFVWPLYMLDNSSKWTIPLSVFNFQSKYGTSWNLLYADLIMAALPVIILYLFAQNFIIKGMTSGAVKG